MMNSYLIRISKSEGVKLHGIEHSKARLIARNATHIVVGFAGRSYNPGSRYSGLKTYYSAETTVYRITEENVNDYGDIRVEECITYPTRNKDTR